ncbi:flagellar biosynthesis protein FlhB [Tianweitania sediminis]|jgi:flagellar biosynthetic protein FlhB|uniref:Flagellar biosynthetic protein FlhB n=1 Tax=Tianweitania sediminis TaxID=1502156 RepID=A0A8J7RA54_9HYPH|nr:flagellar biosynthesis protein FlhB [Tianweitania sediminis]MBP0441222.1 flagellar biosynthesis protein FlhB [Tianweitania sediminis]HEV7416050.1 flagellar biosynthesis protein FlhB [Tianweitania sediminis]
MADDAPDKDSKTEAATEKKIRDTVEKGKLPFSREAPILASFLAILTFTLFFAERSIAELGGFLTVFIEQPEAWTIGTAHDVEALLRLVAWEVAKATGLIMGLLVAAGVLASILQNAPRFVLDRITPKMERISLVKGWSRMFGAQGWVEFAKSVAKVLFASIFLVMAMRQADTQLLSGMITDPAAFGAVIRDISLDLLTAMTMIMIVIAVADLIWSRFHWFQDLRMTKQEVKDEMKQAEGDPLVKMRIRSVARDRARQRMIGAVPKATLVIANPTHFAIALRYNRDEDAAPVVVAKGQDLVALKIREIAEANGIPVFEDVALARSMYKQVSVDTVIPPQFYQAVAELVRIIYNKKTAAVRP